MADDLPAHMRPERSFQGLILTLQRFWADQGCVILQPYDMEVGRRHLPSGDHAARARAEALERRLRAAVAPAEGRPLRREPEPAAALLPVPGDPEAVAAGPAGPLSASRSPPSASTPTLHDIRFVEDDWESPTLGAWGLGWECWCDGMEVSQFTYFQQVAGFECAPVAGELTYGLERLAMYVQGVDSVYDLNFNGRDGAEKVTYGDVFLQAEQEYSRHNFEHADTDDAVRAVQDGGGGLPEISRRRLGRTASRSAT